VIGIELDMLTTKMRTAGALARCRHAGSHAGAGTGAGRRCARDRGRFAGLEPDPPAGLRRSGYITIVNDLYGFDYVIDETTGELDPASDKRWRVRGGWTPEFTYFEESRYSGRTNTYALRGGVISRWTVDQHVWRNKATYTGYSAVKTMALISQTRTYDTFLANTRGGALYTIRIPLSGASVAKQVHASTWQAFDTLIAEKCGNQSTLLLGIHEDTRTGLPVRRRPRQRHGDSHQGPGPGRQHLRRLLRQDLLPLLRRRLRSPTVYGE
jgi:hypothetical protein